MTTDPEMMRLLGSIENCVKTLGERFDEHRGDIKGLQSALIKHESQDESRFNFLRGAGAVIAVIWTIATGFGTDILKVFTWR